MSPKELLSALALICLLGLSSCATRLSEEQQDDALIGATAGTIIGAGTGAAIGSSISNGNVWTSAGLGAGVGLIAGAGAGLAYHEISKNNQISGNNDRIDRNREEIFRSQKELDEYREQLLTDTMALEPDREKGEYRYEGPSLGNYAR